MGFPEAEIEITGNLVRNLVDSQFSEFSNLELTFLSEGYDNANFKLGNSMLVRLPRRALGAKLIKHEIEWLPKLKNLLSIKVPSPIKVGASTENFPWPWTITPYFDGNSPLITMLDESELLKLVQFLKQLHEINPKEAPENPHRDVKLSLKADSVNERIMLLESQSTEIPGEVKQLWEQAVLEPVDLKPSLIHGDLHPDNIIVKNGELEAIIDWGDITKGDPATDLASLWMLTDDYDIRSKLFNEYGASPSTILRSKGWAFFYGTIFLDSATKYQKPGEVILKNISQS